MDLLKIFAIFGSGSVFIVVVELIRRGRLKERYSLLWLCASALLLVLSLSREVLEYLSHAMGIYYPPSLLFLLAFLFLLLITLHFSLYCPASRRKKKSWPRNLPCCGRKSRER
jgi:hypothetical protein